MTMKNNPFLRIHAKITLLFVFILALLLCGTFLYVNRSFQHYVYENIRSDLKQKVLLARAFVEQGFDRVDPDRIADQIAENLDLRVTMIDDEGKVTGDSDFSGDSLGQLENHFNRPEIRQAAQASYGESRRFSTSTQKDFLYVATPYQTSGDRGFVRLALPLQEISMVSTRIKKILAVSFAFAFLLSVIVAYFASVLISRPIEKITAGARRIADGNFNSRIFVSGHDEIAVLAGTVNDMAEQIREKIADVELGRSQLEAVFSSMAEGVLVVDGDEKIFLMNKALRSLLGIVEDPMGKRPIEIIRNADIQEMIARSQSQEGLALSREIAFFVPDQKIMRVQSAPIFRYNGVAGAVLVFHDITELRRLENVRKEFVANVSHELRTPVASIKGYAETLLEGALRDPANAEDFVRIISSEAERLAKLIEDLLDLSAIESGKMIKDFSHCPLAPVLNQVLENIRVQARVRDVQVQVTGLEDSMAVSGDELGLFRMFFNLLENAVKYNKEHGRIDVDFNMLGTHIEIKIKDTGVGIPEKDIPRIFERFYRVDKAHSRQIGGTGLGLSIVKHIVQAHNGTIAVQSVPGEGSLFTITLPRG